jgi:hypothetical protein
MQIFRCAPAVVFLHGFLCPAFFVAGGAGAIAASANLPADSGGPAMVAAFIAFGVLTVTGAVLVCAGMLRCRVLVTDQELISRFFWRTTSVPWHDVQGIEITSGTQYYPAARTSRGLVRLKGASGSKQWVENIITAIQAVRTENLARAAQTPDGVLPAIQPEAPTGHPGQPSAAGSAAELRLSRIKGGCAALRRHGATRAALWLEAPRARTRHPRVSSQLIWWRSLASSLSGVVRNPSRALRVATRWPAATPD